MKVARLLGFLLAALMLIPMAHADGPVTMVFQNVNGANDGQYYVSPYTGTMNGQTVTLFCDDVLNDVNFGQTWRANVTNLGTAIQSNDFSQTRYGGVPSSLVYGNAARSYQDRVAHHTIRIQFQQLSGPVIRAVVLDESEPDQVRYRRSTSLAGHGRHRLHFN
jgi:hypothetical protein